MKSSPIDEAKGEDPLAEVWKALGDPTRRGILDQLRMEPANTGALCLAFPKLGRHAVIRHLKILIEAGFVRVEPQGRERINHINPVPLQQIYERWMRPYEELWSEGLVRLGAAASARQRQQNEQEVKMKTNEVRVIDIHVEHDIEATPATVWDTLTEEPESWWTFGHNQGPGVRLDATIGGYFFDDLGDGNAYTYGVIRGVNRNVELIMDGTFGMAGAVHGQVKITLTELAGDGTKVAFAHQVVGAVDPDAEQGHTSGWTELLSNLVASSERNQKS